LYEEHFGLTPRPFGGPAGASAVVPLPSRDAALRRLRYGIEHRRGPALLFGPPGTGKTLLARSLASEMAGGRGDSGFPGGAGTPPTQPSPARGESSRSRLISGPSRRSHLAPPPLVGEGWGGGTPDADPSRGPRTVHLTFPAMPAADLLAYLADDLAPGDRRVGPGPVPTLAASVRRLRGALASAARRDERPLLIVDEAHLIDDPATFEALRLLLNFATEGSPDLSLLLVGGPEVLLNLPPALADRMTARCLLGPLTAAESAAYVLGRLSLAGARGPLFDPPSLLDLHRAADGLPRHLDRLADLALLIAFANGLDRPGPAEVLAAARDPGFETLAA